MTRGLAGLAVVIGLLWAGQGLGWIGGSFMSGDLRWTWIGVAVGAVGGGVLVVTRRKG